MSIKIKKLSIFYLSMLLILIVGNNVQAQNNVQVISKITVEGNVHIEKNKILSVISTKVGDLFDEEELKKDLQSVYGLGYFQDVSMPIKPYQGGLNVIFKVIEYPIIKDIVIKGNVTFSDEKFLALLDIKEGEVLNQNKLVEGKKSIEQLYHDKGYILARFVDIDIPTDGIVVLQFNEGYINNIIIKGNEETKDFVILRELEFAEGDILNINQVKKSFPNLGNLHLFKEINPKLEYVRGRDNAVDVIIEVTEAETGEFYASVGYNTRDSWIGAINYEEKNLLGKGQILGLNWEFGGVTNYSINFYEPWLMGTDTSFGIGLYDRSYNGENSEKGDYKAHRRGGSISFGHKLIDGWKSKIRFKIEDSTIDWVEDNEDENVSILSSEDASVRSLTFQVNRNTTIDPFNPCSGAVDTFSVEYAGQLLGGDHNFTKYNVDLRRYYPGFWNENVWGIRFNAGTASGNLPALERFRLGGSQSIRGYDNGTFSGENMILLNLEYRFPIVKNFIGVIFTDAGNAWDEKYEIDLGDLHFSYGLGLRMNTPFGQISLDYGFNEEGDGQPHFGIGQSF